MKKILITGATGNIGQRLVARLLHLQESTVEIHLAVRNINEA